MAVLEVGDGVFFDAVPFSVQSCEPGSLPFYRRSIVKVNATKTGCYGSHSGGICGAVNESVGTTDPTVLVCGNGHWFSW